MFRKFLFPVSCILVVIALVLAEMPWARPVAAAPHALGATITVNSTAQEVPFSTNGNCTLGEAIHAANTNTVVDGCIAGTGDDTIIVPAGTYTLTAVYDTAIWNWGDVGLPRVTAPLTITGDSLGGTEIVRDMAAPKFTILQVSGTTLTLNYLTLENGDAFGGMAEGGAVDFHASALIVNDSIFINNHAVEGGALCADHFSGILTVNRSAFYGNTADQRGGAIYISPYSDISITDSIFDGNTAVNDGGALAAVQPYLGSAVLNITNSVFEDNHATPGPAGHGGAIFSWDMISNITGSVIRGNTAKGHGGGAFLRGTNTITNTTIANNTTAGTAFGWGRGGGIYAEEGPLTIVGSTISGNTADNGGGGVSSGFHGSTTIRNSTISGNTVGGGYYGYGGGLEDRAPDGGLHLYNVTITGNSVTSTVGEGGGLWKEGEWSTRWGYAQNTIIAGNTSAYAGPDCYMSNGNAVLVSSGYTLLGNNSGCNFTTGTGDIVGTGASPVDALLAPLANNGGPTETHAPYPGSPALEAGSPNVPGSGGDSCESTDQRGVARPQGAVCDMGAFEYEAPSDTTPPAVASITRADANPTAAASLDFTVTFSESVTGVDVSDFTPVQSGVSGATVSGVSGSGDTYTVTVNTGNGDGTLGLDLTDDDSILDAASNPLGGAGAGNGDFTGEVYTVDKTLPADGAVLPNKRPAFDWEDMSGVIGYQLQVAKTAAFNFGTLTKNSAVSNYTFTTDLSANTLYYWRVRAKLTATTYGPWSVVRTFTTGNPPSVPTLSAPAKNALTTNASPLFDWSNSTVSGGAVFDHYQVQIATDAGFAIVIHDHNVGVLQDNDAVLTPAATYYWRVRSFAADGDYSAWSAVRSLRIAYTAPVLTAPANASVIGSLTPTFTWDAVAGAASYHLQVSRDATFTLLVVNNAVAAPTYVQPTNLLAATTYYWRVKIKGPYGPSAWSATFSFTTP